MANATSTRTSAAGTGFGENGNLSLISTQLSWMRSDILNLHALLVWARTSVSMIGFGFTTYNFYGEFFEDIGGTRGDDAWRNLGQAQVTAGTLAMLVTVWNFWSINKALAALDSAFPIPHDLEQRWIYSYVLAVVLMLIGLITLLFMLRVI